MWIYLKDNKIILHTENDGPTVLRKGLESEDKEVTLEFLNKYYPRLYEETVNLLSKATQR